ncbi:MAG: hypothetical protein ACREBD_11670 [Blastocatellia bacterium]
MKIRLVFPALVVYFLAAASLSGLMQQASATQSAFVQGNQPRNQGQNQRGLSPEKKKSLSKYGPEDAFPETDEPEANRRQGARTTPPARTSSAPKYSPGPKQSATPVAKPSLILAPAIPASPSPTTAAALRNPVQQSTPAPRSSTAQPASDWTAPVLLGLALIVSVALIYVLIKLRERIREGSSG